MKRQLVIIDVDTGVDDALALVMACASEELNILGVTTVAGNVGIEHTTQNTLNVLHLLGCGSIPVARGAEAPLARRLLKASGVHGITGLRGWAFAQNTVDAMQSVPAWQFMRDMLMTAPEKVTIIALAPLTNLAILLDKFPEVREKIERIVFMGTSWHDGNPTPIATFNVLVDPEAFRKVIHAGIPFYAMPLDTTRKAYLSAQDAADMREIAGIGAQFSSAVLDGYGNASEEELALLCELEDEEEYTRKGKNDAQARDKISVHDLATVAFVTNPELFSFNKYFCDVECSGELTTGFTLIDKANWYHKDEKEKNLYLIETVDRAAFVKTFLQALHRYETV